METTYTIDQIRSIVAPIAKQFGVEKVYLFGSYATNSAAATSDIDLRIDKGKIMSLLTLSDFMLSLEDQLKLPIDIVTTESLDESFLELIAKDEVLIYEESGFDLSK